MPLHNCKTCGNHISTNAVSCPHCGEPNKINKKKPFINKSDFGCLFVIAIFVFFGYLIGGESNDKPQPSGCSNNFKLCTDNGDLAKNYAKMVDIKSSCKYEVEKNIRYGKPGWSFFSFDKYQKGNNYISSGVAMLLDDEVKIQNIYGAYEKSNVICEYDLNSEKILSLLINGTPVNISGR